MNTSASLASNNTLHRRLSVFVDWVATDQEREKEIETQRKDVRSAISTQAQDDALVIRATPDSGSFATRTGLRRHMRGLAEVEGQDVDVSFVVAPKTKDDEKLEALLPRFEKYARLSYPTTDRETTKSSVKLKFTNNLNYDLVPLLATADPARQILIRAGGERRETSVQKHVEFIRSRTAKSQSIPGVVEFNEVVRLLKWWRCFRQTQSGVGLTDVPSFLVNLLAAHAFDVRGVRATYGETIADWFGHLARVCRTRTPISFADFSPAPAAAAGAIWSVHDPVNAANNVVSNWTGIMCDELADWLEEARDAMYDAIAAFDDGRDTDGLSSLATVFGTPVLHHSEAS